MSHHEELAGEFDKIFKYAIKPDLESFLSRTLPGDVNANLPHLLKKKRGEQKKPDHVSDWKQLDLKELLEVLDDRFSRLKVDNWSAEAKKAVQRLRDLRNESAHWTGEVDLHGLYADVALLERFANFIGARQETIAEIQKLRRRFRVEFESLAGARSEAAGSASEPGRDFFRPTGDPFAEFDRLLRSHELFVGRGQVIDRIEGFVAEHTSGTLILEAEPGTGKSALVARCIGEVFAEAKPRPVYYLYHRSEGLTRPGACLRTLYAQLVQIHEVKEAEPLEAADEARVIREKLDGLLHRHVAPRLAGRKQLIFIDALDEAIADGDLSAYQALPDDLPQGVLVIASSRPLPARSGVLARRNAVERLDLNSPDFNAPHYQDAKEFVASRLAGKTIDETTREEICRVAGGNFLVLSELCRRASDKLHPHEVRELLRRLAIEPEAGRLHLIYEDDWRRLPTAELDTLGEVAGLLLECREPANVQLAVAALERGLAKWEAGLRALSEYLRELPREDGPSSYRFYHQSFADFLPTRVQPTPIRLRSSSP